MTEWTDKMSTMNDGYLIMNAKTDQLLGIIEAEECKHDIEIAVKMS